MSYEVKGWKANAEMKKRVEMNECIRDLEDMKDRCSDDLTELRMDRNRLENEIMQLFAVGDEDQAKMNCYELEMSDREMKILTALRAKVHEQLVNLRAAARVSDLNVRMKAANQLLSVTPKMVTALSLGTKYRVPAWMEEITRGLPTHDNETNRLFNEMKERYIHGMGGEVSAPVNTIANKARNES